MVSYRSNALCLEIDMACGIMGPYLTTCLVSAMDLIGNTST